MNTAKVINIPNFQEHLGIFFPNEGVYLRDGNGSSDKAQHPVVFVCNGDNYDKWFGFRMTSHPMVDDELQEFFFEPLSKGEDVEYTDSFKAKDIAYISCEKIDIFLGYMPNFFGQKGYLLKEIYIQKITNAVIKYVFCQENGLALKSYNYDELLEMLNIKKEDIIRSQIYRKLVEKQNAIMKRESKQNRASKKVRDSLNSQIVASIAELRQQIEQQRKEKNIKETIEEFIEKRYLESLEENASDVKNMYEWYVDFL